MTAIHSLGANSSIGYAFIASHSPKTLSLPMMARRSDALSCGALVLMMTAFVDVVFTDLLFVRFATQSVMAELYI